MPFTPEERLARRLRREARRAKQRELNVHRAAAMHASRMAFAKSHSAKAPRSPEKPSVHIGCSGWFYWHWRDLFYPRDLPGSEWFDHYASQFRTVELNAPFYAWPTVGTVNTWIRQARRRRFIYTVKVCELITHIKRFNGTKQLVRDFGHIADLLGPKMGCFLFQLPPSFHYTPARLRRIVDQLDPARRNVVEFRHRSWWNEDVYAAFRERHITFCSCSGPRLPDELIQTSDQIYIRFHGLKQWYRHDYTPGELAVWAQRIRESGARHVWAYFNNDRNGNAIRNAQQLIRQLRLKSK